MEAEKKIKEIEQQAQLNELITLKLKEAREFIEKAKALEKAQEDEKKTKRKTSKNK